MHIQQINGTQKEPFKPMSITAFFIRCYDRRWLRR